MLALLLVISLRASAQTPPLTFPGSQAVGASSSPVTVTVTMRSAGSVATVQVLTLGAPGLDFSANGAASCANTSISAGQQCTQSVVFTPSAPGIRLGAVVLLDGGNHVLGMAYLSGVGLGGLGVFTQGSQGTLTQANVITVAGTYRQWTSTKDGIAATTADLDEPTSIAFDGGGDMYIADSVHNKIRKVDTTGIISTVAGNGDSGDSGDGAPAQNATLGSPSGVAVDGAGNIYIADTGNNVIRRIDAATSIITTVAGNGTPGFAGDGSPADQTNTELNSPVGVTLDVAGNLYIADTGNQRIRRIDAATGVITTVAGNGAVSGLGDGKGTYTGDGGAATAAGLSQPYTVAFDSAGNMFIPDSGNDCIRRVDATTKNITTVAGVGQQAGSNDGSTAEALLDEPSGVAVDPAGNLYISDTQNFAIRKVNVAAATVSTLVSNSKGNSLNSGTTPPTLSPVQIFAPVGLYFDGKGNLFFADRYYMLVHEIESNSAILNFTSTPVLVGSQSATPLLQTVENDGNAPLDVASFTLSNDANAVIDTVGTTCSKSSPLKPDNACAISAYFAPDSSIVIPAGLSSVQVKGNVDDAGATPNTPLDVVLVGEAAPVSATTLTLSSSPSSPSWFGQNVTFTATVSALGGNIAPTGTVGFTIDGAPTVPASIALSASSNRAGRASYSTTSPLAVGQHTIAATYTPAKNVSFVSSANTLTQEVDEETATSLASSMGSKAATAGSTVTFTAMVSTAGGGGITPDGTVTFYDGPSALGNPVPLSGGTAAFATSALADGTHSIWAQYSGDPAKYIQGSKSGTLNQDVQGSSSASLASSLNPSIYGHAAAFTFTVFSSSGTPATGTVTFSDGTTKIGTASLTNGAGSFATSSLAAGSHTIVASYPGDAYDGAVSQSITQTVNQAPTAVTLGATPNPAIAGKPAALVATVALTSGSGTPTGTVTFSDGSTQLGSAKLGAGGTAKISPTLAPGSHSILATYSGDSNDNGSASAALVLPVDLATTSVALSSSSTPSTALSPVTFTAVVAGNGVTPTGTVSFSVDGKAADTVTLDTTGKASFSDSSLIVGSHAIIARYSGDTDNNPSTSASLTQAVTAIATVTSLGTSATSGNNPQTILIASVLGASGPTPTGTVTFSNGSTVIGTAPLDASGVATLTPDLAPATYNIVAGYGGDSLHAASNSSALKIAGSPTGFAITVNPSTITLQSSQNVNVTVTLASSNGYSDTIGLGCGKLPPGVNCHFTSNNPALKAGSTATVQLTIDTNLPLGGGSTAMNAHHGRGGSSLAALFFPVWLLFGWVGWRFRKRNAVVFTAILILLLSGSLFATGCGASFSQNTAAAGTYSIDVTGVGVNSNITHYQTITLTITK